MQRTEAGKVTFQVLFIWNPFSTRKWATCKAYRIQLPLGCNSTGLLCFTSFLLLPIHYWHSFVDLPYHSEHNLWFVDSFHFRHLKSSHQPVNWRHQLKVDLNAYQVKHLYDKFIVRCIFDSIFIVAFIPFQKWRLTKEILSNYIDMTH
jgi:hypothetical protein